MAAKITTFLEEDQDDDNELSDTNVTSHDKVTETATKGARTEQENNENNENDENDETAPTAISFAESTKNYREAIEKEKKANKNHLKLTKKRKPKWAQKETQIINERKKKEKKELNNENKDKKLENLFENEMNDDFFDNNNNNSSDNNDDDNENENENEIESSLEAPPLKKQRLNENARDNKKGKAQIGWITESDMFGNNNNNKNNNNKSNNNNNTKNNKNNKNENGKNRNNNLKNENEIKNLIYQKLTESNNLSKANLALFANEIENNKSRKRQSRNDKNNDNNNNNNNRDSSEWSSTVLTESKKGESDNESDNDSSNDKNDNNENENSNENENENENEMNDFLDDMPIEVLEAFERALNETENEKEIKDKWAIIIENSIKNNSKLRNKKTKFDQIFVENGMFELKVHNTFCKNVSSLKRALRMKTFNFLKHRRQDYNKQRSMGRYGPSYHFNHFKNGKKLNNDNSSNNKELANHIGNTVWGQKITHNSQKQQSDDLSRWLNEW